MAASSGVGGGPFAAMMPAFAQAACEYMANMGITTTPFAGPTLKFGPFNRKGSSLSVRTDATERDCPPTEIDPLSEEDQLGKLEEDMAAAKAAVKGGKKKKTSASAPAAPEPAGPKPKSKARKDRKATAKAKVLAAVAAKAAAKAPPKAKVLAAAKAAAKAPPKAKVKAVAKAAAAAATTGGPIAKRPAASAPKLDKFNIETWMKNNVTRAEAENDTERRYFCSRIHHRIHKAAKDAGMSAAIVSKLRELACANAGKLWDSLHPKKVG